MNRIVRGAFFLSAVFAIFACTSPTTVFSEEAFTLGRTSVSTGNPQPGDLVSVSTDVVSSMDANGVIVQIVIVDPNSNAVVKEFWEGQNFDRGDKVTYSMEWAIPAYLSGGDYVASVGVFDANWSQIEWFDRQVTLKVDGSNGEAFTLGQAGFSAARVQPGQEVSASAAIASGIDADDLIVSLYIFDSKRQAVARQNWEGQSFLSGETLTYDLDWPTPALQYAGDYTFSVGIFDANWSQVRWFDTESTLSIDKPAAAVAQALPAADLKLENTPLDKLPGHFGVGVKANEPGSFDWMAKTGAPFDYSYVYLAGGVNTGEGWSDWSSSPGDYALRFMESSHDQGSIPILTYYQIVHSLPERFEEPSFNTLVNPETMNAYFEDWILLLKMAAEFGEPVIIHHEPDLWGYLQFKGDDPTRAHVAVGTSGHPDVAGLEDNARGFAQALIKLRNDYAPNALLGWHASFWATGTDLILQDADGKEIGGRIADFYLKLQAPFDLTFYEAADRDAGWRKTENNQDADWNEEDFARFFDYLSTIQAKVGLKAVIWQIPLGNTLYRSMSNTPGHYQNNHAEYYLLAQNRQNVVDLASIGVVGLLFGEGAAEQTSFIDLKGDGITNPAPINGNELVAEFPDDDGGFMRLNSKAFYEQGPIPVP